MSLVSGTRLGPYEVTAKLGQGGMGEVFQAEDTRLRRAVALKVLPTAFANDPVSLARFEREAKFLASLNHPNIAQIYGLEGAAPSPENPAGVCAIAMELVEGPTLAERLAHGPIALDEALTIGWQIADALDAAHDKGIVHRDLKPANIKLAPDRRVKVLDFGIARSIDPGGDVTRTLTSVDTIAGTPAYMSPEQVEGRPIDKRTDIWAFGVVLYEMLAGVRLFGGETMAATFRAVLTKEPDWTAIPPEVRPLLRRCLERDPRHRLRDIGDARLLVAERISAVRRLPPPRLPWILASVATAGMIAAVALVPSQTSWDRPLMKLDVDLAASSARNPLVPAVVSPDGTHIAFPVAGSDGRAILAVRRLDQSASTQLAGTQEADQPFFSPDGRWLGFFAGGKLKKVSISGGTPVELCDASIARGGSWGDDGSIVAALSNGTGLSRIPSAGGGPQPITTTGPGDPTHRWPQILPGARAVLFTGRTPSINIYEDASVEAVVLETGERKTLWRGGYFGRFLPTKGTRGHLAFISRGVLFAVPFDAQRLQIEGTPVPVIQDVGSDPGSAAGRFAFSDTGILLYRTGIGTLSWSVAELDGAGNTTPVIEAPGLYYSPRFSPDGRRLAVGIDTGTGPDLYVHDQQRGRMTRLTFSGGINADAVWSPDGTHIAYRARAERGMLIASVRADGGGEPVRLLARGTTIGDLSADSFAPDGRHFMYSEIDPDGRGDVWVLPLDRSDPDHPKAGAPVPILQTPFNEHRPAFSPDGRWVAYSSDESGRHEVYVRAFEELLSGRQGRWQVSVEGGVKPMWSNDRRALFFVGFDGRIMRVEYGVTGRVFVPGKPEVWSQTRLFDVGFTNLDLSPDGERFAILLEPPGTAPPAAVHVTFLLNFFDELRRRDAGTR
jgi:serine/threonine-protein kinase